MGLLDECCPITINVFKRSTPETTEATPAAPAPWAPEYERFSIMLTAHTRYVALSKKKDSRGLSADEAEEMKNLRCSVSVKFLEDASGRTKETIRGIKRNIEYVETQLDEIKQTRATLKGGKLKTLDKQTITLYRKKAELDVSLVKESADLEMLQQQIASWPKLCRLPPTA